MTLTSRLLPLALALMPLAAAAQTHPTHRKTAHVTVVNDPEHRADTADVYHTLTANAPQHPAIPGAPRFAIVGAKGKFYLGLGGAVKATASFDWDHPVASSYAFTTSAIPMTQSPGNGGLFQVGAQSSSVFLNCVALPGSKNQVGAYIGFNFTGANYGFNLQNAYLTFRGFTAGWNYTMFADMASAPLTIDYEGPSSLSALSNGVVNYRHDFGKHWTLALGAEMPMLSATYGSATAAVSQRVPDIPAFVQYSWADGGSWLRLSALYRNMLYRDVAAGRNRDCTGWGLKISGSATPLPLLTLYWQATYGRGLANYFQDTNGLGLDMVPDPERPGRLKAVKAWGGFAAVQFNISPTVTSTVVYSHVRDYAPASTAGATQYSYAQYALANVLWNITPVVQCGLEYIHGRRVDLDHASASDNRLQAMLQVSF